MYISYVHAAKLKALKFILKSWNREVFARAVANKREALRKVSFWDDMEKNRVLPLEEVEERSLVKEDFKRWSLMEEVSWRQKFREIWLKDGDRNTSFFYRMANSPKRKNFLKKIRIVGYWVKEDLAIKRGVVDAFQHLPENPGG